MTVRKALRYMVVGQMPWHVDKKPYVRWSQARPFTVDEGRARVKKTLVELGAESTTDIKTAEATEEDSPLVIASKFVLEQFVGDTTTIQALCDFLDDTDVSAPVQMSTATLRCQQAVFKRAKAACAQTACKSVTLEAFIGIIAEAITAVIDDKWVEAAGSAYKLVGAGNHVPTMVATWFSSLDMLEDFLGFRCSLVLYMLEQFCRMCMTGKVNVSDLEPSAVKTLGDGKLRSQLVRLDASLYARDKDWVFAWAHLLSRSSPSVKLPADELFKELAEYCDRAMEKRLADFSREHPELVGRVAGNDSQADDSLTTDALETPSVDAAADEPTEDVAEFMLVADVLADRMAPDAYVPPDMSAYDYERQLLDMFGPMQHANHDPDVQDLKVFIQEATHEICMSALQGKASDRDPNCVSLDEGKPLLSRGSHIPTPETLHLTFVGRLCMMPTEHSFPACRAFGRTFYVAKDETDSDTLAWCVPTVVDDSHTLSTETITVTVSLRSQKPVKKRHKEKGTTPKVESFPVKITLFALTPRVVTEDDNFAWPTSGGDVKTLTDHAYLSRCVGGVEKAVRDTIAVQKSALAALKASLTRNAQQQGSNGDWMKECKHLIT